MTTISAEHSATHGWRIEIAGCSNARVFGGERQWLVRSANLDGIKPGGVRALKALGVTLAIDLREPGERGTTLHDVPVKHIPLYGSLEAPVLGSLEDAYLDLLAARRSAFAHVIGEIADNPGCTLVHCAVGKDRTGLVVALALLAARHPLDRVIADYALSQAQLPKGHIRSTRTRCADLGIDVDSERGREFLRLHLGSPAEAIAEALAWVDRRGGVEGYLLGNGLTLRQLKTLRAKAEAA
jgi:protein-tyrosine phosphatase